MPEPLSVKDLREYRTIAPSLHDVERNLIESLFGSEIKTLVGDRKKSTHLAEGLFGLALDPGLRKKPVFLDVLDNDKEVLDPVAMLNRQSFLTELRKKIGFKEEKKDDGVVYSREKNFSIFQLDLANLRKADETRDKAQNSAGDYNLNIVASALNEFVRELASKRGYKINYEDIIIGRYGGDEFSLALIGDNSQEKKTVEMIQELLKNKIESKLGYFQKDKNRGTVEKKNFRLKGNKVDVITPPEGTDKNSENKKKFFYSFLKRGLILDEEQLNFEIDYIVQTHSDIDKYLKEVLLGADTEYSGLDIKGKIDYLTKKHPELKIPFFLTRDKDGKDNEDKQKTLLNFVENYLIDPLLDEIVISRFDLPNHMKNDKFTTIHSFELKLKEIDDHLSYVYGDQLIMDLWKKKLKILLDPYIKDGSVKIGRFAGTIFIGEIENGLPADVRNKLKEINEVILNYKGEKLSHSVGYAEIDSKIINDQSTENEIKQKINEIFNKPTNDWLKKVFERLFSNPSDLEEFKSIYKNLDPNFKYTGKNYFVLIAAKYFNGKRWEARSSLVLEVFEQMKDKNGPEAEIIKELFAELKPKLVQKYKDE